MVNYAEIDRLSRRIAALYAQIASAEGLISRTRAEALRIEEARGVANRRRERRALEAPMIRARLLGAALSLVLVASACSCSPQGAGMLGTGQGTGTEAATDTPLTEREQVMKENKDLFRERLAELEIDDAKREPLLDYLFQALWQFEMGHIQDLAITLNEAETESSHFAYKVYDIAFNDDLGFEYAGSIDDAGGVSAFTQRQYYPETGIMHSELAAPPIS